MSSSARPAPFGTATSGSSMARRCLRRLGTSMSTAGIEHQAVQTMGYERTNVVFYTDVRVDDFYRVGEVDGGLHVMRAALEAEQNIAPAARTPPLFEAACAWAEQAAGPDGTRMIDNPRVRDRLARLA